MVPLFQNRICKVGVLVAAALIFPALAYAQENNPVAAPQTQIDSLQATVASLQKTIASLQATVASLQNQANSLQASNASLQNQVSSLQASNTTLQTEVSAAQKELTAARSLLALAPYVRVDRNPEIGVIGPNIVFSGANIHIVSGSGATDDNLSKGKPLSGLGNLIIGYNEDPTDPVLRFGGTPLGPDDRGGSHNLVIGRGHRFTKAAFGGLVVGEGNQISTEASVLGGGNNTASGFAASVLGGSSNSASGDGASVSGGVENSAGLEFQHSP